MDVVYVTDFCLFHELCEHASTVRGQNATFYILKTCGTYSNHCILKFDGYNLMACDKLSFTLCPLYDVSEANSFLEARA